MLLPLLTISALIFPFFSRASPSQTPLLPSTPDHGPHVDNARKNAPQIFNALHCSMRQWGSSLKHNGMRFFRACIPNNTLLYHGTHKEVPATRMEWLAIEIEHAEAFALLRPPPGRSSGRRGDRPANGRLGEPGRGPPSMEFMEEFTQEELSEESLFHAYLDIYRTKHLLSNLLYIDGMSAKKTPIRTMNTQDLILHTNDSKSTHPRWDYQRAEDLCAIG